MKHYYTALILAFCSCAATAQNFELFNAGSKKAFTTSPIAGNTYNLGFEDVQVNGDNSTFYPYKGIEDYEIEMGAGCMTPSSSGFCFPETRSGWMGNNVEVNNSTQVYTFQTLFGANLLLNLNQETGESVIFYEDSIQKFQFNRLSDSYENVLGIIDSVRNLEIIHTDLEGNIINSALNSFVVKTGKALGMINFFAIDSFPQIQRPLVLIGNSTPEAGITQITNEDLYSLMPGDELQFNEKSMKFTCHAEILYDRFIKLNYLERTDTPDSIIFYCRREMFQRDSLKLETDSVRLSYARNTVVATLPFNYSGHNGPLYRKSLVMNDYCGEPLWSFSKTYTHMWYCEETNCWSWQDFPEFPLEESETVVWGVGRYFYHESNIIEDETYVYEYQVNYFKKGEQVCGDQLIVSSKNISLPAGTLSVYPNPATETITLSGFKTGNIRIVTIDGKTVKQVNDYTTGQKLLVNDLINGIYIVSVETNNEVLMTKLVINISQ
ncbi:MAG: T9SS type A sorting domain-containing protein [Methanococcaceae archaeon]